MDIDILDILAGEFFEEGTDVLDRFLGDLLEHPRCNHGTAGALCGRDLCHDREDRPRIAAGYGKTIDAPDTGALDHGHLVFPEMAGDLIRDLVFD